MSLVRVATTALLASLAACGRSPDASDPVRIAASVPAPAVGAPSSSPPSASAPGSAAAAAPTPEVRAFDASAYPWLPDLAGSALQPVDLLHDRFSPPPGYTRVELAAGSFGSWLRALPLAAPGTLVKSYSGAVLYEANHPNIAAVVALDPGGADLQQCADSIIRLHAEWQWSRGVREMTWRAAAGTMPYQRWVKGDRPVAKGAALLWEPGARPRPRDDHASFRKYLDAVFMFANTGSLAQQAQPVEVTELAPGDFVVMPGAPGHAVLVLDAAVGPGGRKVALLGQGYMPAQNFQVLRPSPSRTWFEIEPSEPGLKTPFWRRFGWSMLRRL